VDLLARRLYERLGVSPRAGAYWPADEYRVPRVCSWCGAAHPDDVVVLISHGWRLDHGWAASERSTLHVPFTRLGQLGHSEHGAPTVVRFDPPPDPWPGVEVVLEHFNEEQFDALCRIATETSALHVQASVQRSPVTAAVTCHGPA
jgi:hypothetical protein